MKDILTLELYFWESVYPREILFKKCTKRHVQDVYYSIIFHREKLKIT